MLKVLTLLLMFLSLQAELLTQEEAITKAIAYHPDIKHFIYQVTSSEERVKATRSDYLPQVHVNAEYDPTRTYVLPQNGQFNTIQSDGWQAGVVLNQKIWDFGKTGSAIDSSKVDTKIAELSLSDAKALLAYNVKRQYALMVVQHKAVAVRKKDMEAKEMLYKQSEAMFTQGMRTRADATRFLSSYYVAVDNLSISEAAYEKARVALSLYMGEVVDANVTLQEDLLSPTETRYDDGDLLYGEIEEKNPQLKSAQESVHKSELLYKSVHASHYGSIDAVASYNHQDTLNSYDATLVGITLTIPLYVGGRISAQAQQAKLAQASAKAAYASRALALEQEVQGLFIDLKRYEKTIKAKQSQLEASKQTQTLLNARYKEGLSTYIEVLDATALYLNAELGLLEAYYSRSVILNRIDYLEGKTL